MHGHNRRDRGKPNRVEIRILNNAADSAGQRDQEEIAQPGIAPRFLALRSNQQSDQQRRGDGGHGSGNGDGRQNN